jgi:hypothetical protein
MQRSRTAVASSAPIRIYHRAAPQRPQDASSVWGRALLYLALTTALCAVVAAMAAMWRSLP